jgi:hypothetical protein
MNKIRFSFFAVGAALLLATGSLHAQTSIQQITFALLAEYQTNTFYTNTANPTGALTNEHSVIQYIAITTPQVVRAMLYDLYGTNWIDSLGAVLVREVNLTTGNEGVFLRRNGTNLANVSSFFGGSYSNNFTAGLTNAFPAATNFAGLTNTFMPQLEIDRGWRRMTADSTNITTNFVATGGLYFVSLNTTNIKFNLVAVGNGGVTNIAAGTSFERAINWQLLGSAGSFYLNTTTNFLDNTNDGDIPPVYLTGPIRGTFSTTPPIYSPIAGP